VRNIFRGEAPEPAALAHVSAGLRAFAATLDGMNTEAVLAGAFPD